MSGSDPVSPRVIIKPKRALPFFSHHPWVFGGAISHIEGDVEPGDEVAVFTHDEKFIAWGLFNPHSQIRVRLFSWEEEARIDRELWSQLLDSAFRLRIPMFREADAETAARLVFSEGDGLSGLVVDQFGEWLLVQVTSLAVAEQIDLILDLLMEKLNPRGIYLRTEKGMSELEQLEMQDSLVRGEAPPQKILIKDSGVRYEVDVMEGQKNRLLSRPAFQSSRLHTIPSTQRKSLGCLLLFGRLWSLGSHSWKRREGFGRRYFRVRLGVGES